MIRYTKIQYSSINEIAALKVKTSTFNSGKEKEGILKGNEVKGTNG